MSQIITFYSYKGGVGRSMSLANVGVLLSQWGYKTLLIDWDLEAPGLENFFKEYSMSKQKISSQKGMVDFLDSLYSPKKKNIKWQDCLIPISISPNSEPIHLISGGKRDRQYTNKLRNFNVRSFYDKFDGGNKIEKFRNEIMEYYDFVLIDSRTGVTDFGGICTIQLPDILVLFSTLTDQGVYGIKEVAEKAVKNQLNIPYDRQKLMTFPIPTRVDSQTEFKTTQEWIGKFAKVLSTCFDDWLPKGIERKKFIELIKIPYIPFFSYGEQLPVIVQGTSDPTGLGYAYENLASILVNSLNFLELFTKKREEFIRNAKTKLDLEKNNNNHNDNINIFISYSHDDIKKANNIISYLSILKSLHDVNFWSDLELRPGQNWNKTITENILNSDIFIFLLSTSALNNKSFNRDIDKVIMEKKDNPIIPIILSESLWEDSPISKYQALPSKAKPISTFKNKETAYKEILKSLNSIIENYKRKKAEKKLLSIKPKDKNVESSLSNIKAKNFIIELVSKNRLQDSFKVLKANIEMHEDSKTHEIELILIQSRYNELMERDKNNLLSYEEYIKNLNQVSFDVIDLMHKILD